MVSKLSTCTCGQEAQYIQSVRLLHVIVVPWLLNGYGLYHLRVDDVLPRAKPEEVHQ